MKNTETIRKMVSDSAESQSLLSQHASAGQPGVATKPPVPRTAGEAA